ncbi:MAG: phage tail protein [Fibrobacter sp.]|nr:phage tail protein [Fibrobacter sp.]
MGDTVDWSFPVVFHFSVKLDNSEVAFSEVSGLDTTIETKDVRSGGDNSTVYHLPEKVKLSDLVMKRAVLKDSDPFFRWCMKNASAAMNAFRVAPKPIEISLLDVESEPIATWTIEGAYPFKWAFNTLNAMKSEVMIETVSLKYRSIERIL